MEIGRPAQGSTETKWPGEDFLYHRLCSESQESSASKESEHHKMERKWVHGFAAPLSISAIETRSSSSPLAVPPFSVPPLPCWPFLLLGKSIRFTVDIWGLPWNSILSQSSHIIKVKSYTYKSPTKCGNIGSISLEIYTPLSLSTTHTAHSHL